MAGTAGRMSSLQHTEKVVTQRGTLDAIAFLSTLSFPTTQVVTKSCKASSRCHARGSCYGDSQAGRCYQSSCHAGRRLIRVAAMQESITGAAGIQEGFSRLAATLQKGVSKAAVLLLWVFILRTTHLPSSHCCHSYPVKSAQHNEGMCFTAPCSL